MNYCGSKTKKCLTCGKNVCLKDEDMHNFGGECERFRKEEISKKEKEERERKIKEQEERKRIEIV